MSSHGHVARGGDFFTGDYYFSDRCDYFFSVKLAFDQLYALDDMGQDSWRVRWRAHRCSHRSNSSIICFLISFSALSCSVTGAVSRTRSRFNVC